MLTGRNGDAVETTAPNATNEEANRMQLNIGGIVAKCYSCGSNEFASLRPNAADRGDRLACVRCCTEVLYEDLLSRIARAAIVRRSAPKHDTGRSQIA
jgi:hypothetical protein